MSETRGQKTGALENSQRRLNDVKKTSQQLTESLDESQSKVDTSRVNLMDLQIHLEKER